MRSTRSAALRQVENRPKLSYRDYVLFPDNGKRHEIIDGDHFMTPSPSTKHQRISRNIEWIIESFLKKERSLKKENIGEIFDAPCDVVLSEHDIVVPDLVYVSRKNKGIITQDNIKGSPDLIIEILSAFNKSHDRILKKDLYEAFGVREYWIIDPGTESVEVYSLSAHRFLEPKVYHRDQVLKTEVIQGLEVKLAEVFSF